MFEVKDLTYEISGIEILSKVNINIPDQALTAIVGPNGAGKTTFIEIIARVKGENINLPIPKNKNVVYIHPDILILDFLSAKEYIDMITYLNNVTEKELNSILMDFSTLKIKEFWETPIKNLSLGQKQKILLLTGFLSKPDLLLFDEPFNALDINAYEEAIKIFKKYKSKFSIFFSTHELRGLSETCDSIIFIDNGKIKKQLYKSNGDLKNDYEFLQLF